MFNYPVTVNYQLPGRAVQIYTICGIIAAVSHDEAIGKAHRMANYYEKSFSGYRIMNVMVGSDEPLTDKW